MNPEFANDNHHSYIIKESFWGQDVGADVGKLLIKRAGDGDRTRDVQLGKMGVD